MSWKQGSMRGAGLILLLLLLSAGWYAFGSRRGSVEQPIQFSHALHIKNNVQCITCHSHYETTARAGLPGVNTCRRCHEDLIQVGPEESKIEAYYESGREIPWRRVYQLPSHAFFSHRRHVVFGEIDCQTCHGDVASRQQPLTRPLVILKMNDCIACHERRQEKTQLDNVRECIRCHR